jgi:hypothetical protein
MLKKRKQQSGSWILVLFALPFAAVGAGATYFAVSSVVEAEMMKRWVETPAQIINTELKTNYDSDGNTYHVIATYKYNWQGKEYTASRVGISDMSDNLGSYHQDIHRELDSYRSAGKEFRCFVNPADPTHAVLYPAVRFPQLAFITVFALVFGGVGFAMLGAGLYPFFGRSLGAPDSVANDFTSGYAGRFIKSDTQKQLWGFLLLTLFWNALTIPLLCYLPTELQRGNYWGLATLILILPGLFLVKQCAKQLVSISRYGTPRLKLDSNLPRPGDTLRGEVIVRGSTLVNVECTATLRCTEQYWEHDSDGRSLKHRKIWENSADVMSQSALDPAGGGSGAAIKIEFRLPTEEELTETKIADTEVDLSGLSWNLEVTSWAVKPRFETRFDLP